MKMARMSDHHQTLNEQGEGKCSMPLWIKGVPAGFCDDPAYGKQTPRTYRDANGEVKQFDWKYNGVVPALACGLHGGPEFRTFKDGDKWCAVMCDFENLQVSPAGFGDTREEAIEELKKDARIALPTLNKAINDAARFRWWAESSLRLFKIKPAIYARIKPGEYLEFERQGESDLEIIRRIVDHFMGVERAEQEAER